MLDFSQLFSHFLFWRLSSFFWRERKGRLRVSDRQTGLTAVQNDSSIIFFPWVVSVLARAFNLNAL